MKYFNLIGIVLCGFVQLYAQTGPNSPSSATNNTGVGTIPWVNPGNITTSNDVYSSVSASGNTNYLFATNFGFAITSPANVDGIQVEIEKSEVTPTAVSILNGWSNGLTKTISIGTNRCLIVVVAMENGNSVPDIANMTYGGQVMTQVMEIGAGGSGGFSDKLEVWMLLENGISAASGTSIVPTYTAPTLLEEVTFYTSVVFQNVDQFTPVYSSQVTASNASTNPHQLSAPINTLSGSMSVTGVICGNNTSPASVEGGTNTYSVNSSFVEGTDIYTGNASFATSGICVQTATKAGTSTSTEQPVFTFTGSVNRAAMIGFTLQRARGTDNNVQLLKAGTPAGSNLGQTSTSWPVTDTYVSYGDAVTLWGAGWSIADVNDPGFGVALSASKANGNLRVDHVRVTLYTTSTLPIELLEFTVLPSGNEVITRWVTATELNNDYFEIERTADGIVFEPVGMIDGAGNSTSLLSYEFTDPNPLQGISYYRLKQTDFDGTCTYSSFVAVNFTGQTETMIYPNPSADGVFSFLQNGQPTANEVAVFSADLRLVKKVLIVPGEKAIISIADEPDGIYFLIYSENNVQQVSKVEKISREN